MITVREVNRAQYIAADEEGEIADMPEVHYYGQRMFVADAPADTARSKITDAVMMYADPKAYMKRADSRKG